MNLCPHPIHRPIAVFVTIMKDESIESLSNKALDAGACAYSRACARAKWRGGTDCCCRLLFRRGRAAHRSTGSAAPGFQGVRVYWVAASLFDRTGATSSPGACSQGTRPTAC